MNNVRWVSVPLKIGIVAFWVGVIFTVLYSPTIVHWLQSKKSITIFTWPLIFDGKVLREFEEETGIKVYVSFYESNQELLQKIRAHAGNGYDIIVPSDHAVEQLIKDKLIKPFKAQKVAHIVEQILPQLRGHYFDPENVYSLPYYWALHGIGFDSKIFRGDPPATWGALFDLENESYTVGMTSDPREAILLAAFYLYGSIDQLDDPQKIKDIKLLLRKQKKKVAIYSGLRLDDVLISGQAPLALLIGPDALRAQRQNKDIVFTIPEQGTFMNIDSIVLSANTKKDDYIYQFINYMYRPEVIARHNQLFGVYPPTQNTGLENQGLAYLEPGVLKRILFFRNVLTAKQINDIWIDILSH
jgi:spermidine/putrescine transport system substrate-binding protein